MGVQKKLGCIRNFFEQLSLKKGFSFASLSFKNRKNKLTLEGWSWPWKETHFLLSFSDSLVFGIQTHYLVWFFFLPSSLSLLLYPFYRFLLMSYESLNRRFLFSRYNLLDCSNSYHVSGLRVLATSFHPLQYIYNFIC